MESAGDGSAMAVWSEEEPGCIPPAQQELGEEGEWRVTGQRNGTGGLR